MQQTTQGPCKRVQNGNTLIYLIPCIPYINSVNQHHISLPYINTVYQYRKSNRFLQDDTNI
jgi:hypothetical protein